MVSVDDGPVMLCGCVEASDLQELKLLEREHMCWACGTDQSTSRSKERLSQS